jgi:hypothetical protein
MICETSCRGLVDYMVIRQVRWMCGRKERETYGRYTKSNNNFKRKFRYSILSFQGRVIKFQDHCALVTLHCILYNSSMTRHFQVFHVFPLFIAHTYQMSPNQIPPLLL